MTKHRATVNLQVRVLVDADSHPAAKEKAMRICRTPAVQHVTVLQTELAKEVTPPEGAAA